MNPELRALQAQAEQDRTDAIQTQIAQERQSLTARYGDLTDYDLGAVLARFNTNRIASGMNPSLSPLLTKAR